MNSLLMLFNANTTAVNSPDLGSIIGAVLGIMFSTLPFVLTFIILAAVMIIVLALYLAGSIGEFKFLKKVGYDKAWFAFIPVLRAYPIYMIPENRVFNLGVFQIKDRKTAALIGMLAPFGVSAVFVITWLGAVIIPILGFLVYGIVIMVTPVANVALAAFVWRRYFDLYLDYFDQSQAIAFSILATLITPIFAIVMWFVLLKRDYKPIATAEAITSSKE